MASNPTRSAWPQLRVDDWTATRENLHQWLQIVGKIELVSTTLINHWWNVTYQVSSRGLRTGVLMHERDTAFDAEFDFIDSQLVLRTSTGASEHVPLKPQSVADFFSAVMDACERLGTPCVIWASPNELQHAIPFSEDTQPREYDAMSVRLYWEQLLRIEQVFATWRSAFAGKAQPNPALLGIDGSLQHPLLGTRCATRHLCAATLSALGDGRSRV